jgi:hypothetical protein
VYNGKDVSSGESAAEALDEAWVVMGALMNEFIADFRTTHDKADEGHE